jgi:hypothetical protein
MLHDGAEIGMPSLDALYVCLSGSWHGLLSCLITQSADVCLANQTFVYLEVQEVSSRWCHSFRSVVWAVWNAAAHAVI